MTSCGDVIGMTVGLRGYFTPNVRKFQLFSGEFWLFQFSQIDLEKYETY